MVSKWTLLTIGVFTSLVLINIGTSVLYPFMYTYMHMPNGWLYRVRSISFDGATFGDYHGLNPATLSTAAGYPALHEADGINPGSGGPWSVWTDWEDDDVFLGRGEEPLKDFVEFTYFNAFQVITPPGQAGNYTVAVGADDGCEVWMDGQQIISYESMERTVRIDDHTASVYMSEGTHYFIFIVYQWYAKTGFCFRILDSNGNMVIWTYTGTSSTYLSFLSPLVLVITITIGIAYVAVYMPFRNKLF
ncbi:MAG: PA14 domain-containing protein [Candidatus Helarchaeales archaeon]